PHDESLPLVFADWLEERGDPRAAWLRDRSVLPWLGATLDGIIPALLESLKSNKRVVDARRACARIGEGVVPGLVELLRHENHRVRKQAAMCLGKIGKRAQPAFPALLEALGDAEWCVREKVAKALKAVGPTATIELQPLRDALADGNETVRRVAAQV